MGGDIPGGTHGGTVKAGLETVARRGRRSIVRHGDAVVKKRIGRAACREPPVRP